MQTLINSWWLLALCGILNAIFSAMMFLILSPEGPPMLRIFLRQGRSPAAQLGMIALAAGICTVVAGIWGLKKGSSWLLVLNGLAYGAFGLLLRAGPLTFRRTALLVVVMAVSIGIYELATARTLRDHGASEWLLGAAGLVSLGFAVVFLAFVLRWLKLDPSPSAQTFNWLGSFFGFSAICLLGLAVLQLRPSSAVHSPSPAH